MTADAIAHCVARVRGLLLLRDEAHKALAPLGERHHRWCIQRRVVFNGDSARRCPHSCHTACRKLLRGLCHMPPSTAPLSSRCTIVKQISGDHGPGIAVCAEH